MTRHQWRLTLGDERFERAVARAVAQIIVSGLANAIAIEWRIEHELMVEWHRG